MQEVCQAINTQAGTVIVEEQHHLPPAPVVSSFAFTRGRTEYLMRLQQLGSRPSLAFATRKWRDASQNKLFRWICEFAKLEPPSVSFKFKYEIRAEDASAEQIGRCFFIFFWGFSRSFPPASRAMASVQKRRLLTLLPDQDGITSDCDPVATPGL